MKILCLGGGPAGLYFAISMKLRDPAHEVTVLERNRANDTFGWGVVLSDDALSKMQVNDPQSTDAIRDHFAYWDDIAVVHDGVRTVSGGHGFAGIGRKQMLILLQARARELGVDLQFQTEFKSAEEYRKDYDLVVATDGINSLVRKEYEHVFKPDIDTRKCKFVWLGTHQKFDDAFTFIFEKTEHGWVWAHVYQFDDTTATFIVECLPETWDRWGFEQMSKEETVETCRKIFENHLDGHELMSNAAHLRGSAVWMQFPRVICERWYHENVVLMGDSAATGHFSIGSGSRLAFDSAIALAEYLHSEPTMVQAFARYQEERRLEVLRTQSAARNSLEWFEEVERFLDMHPTQFAYSLLTRSQRISHENLRLRDPAWLREAEDWFAEAAQGQKGRRPMFQPFRLRQMELKNRIV
ncbi:MAG: bifunctional salicylyl-CoA 5-hydroxylase/oxidoreductase, partial [Rhodobacteraceae bacterium]